MLRPPPPSTTQPYQKQFASTNPSECALALMDVSPGLEAVFLLAMAAVSALKRLACNEWSDACKLAGQTWASDNQLQARLRPGLLHDGRLQLACPALGNNVWESLRQKPDMAFPGQDDGETPRSSLARFIASSLTAPHSHNSIDPKAAPSNRPN